MYNHNFQRVNQVSFKVFIESLALKQRYLEVTHKKPSNTCGSGKVDINKMMITNDVTMLEKVAFISFLSFYAVWFGYNFVANRYEIQKLDQTLQQSCKSDRLDLLQPNCPWQTVNLEFIEHTSTYRYFHYVYPLIENNSIFQSNFWYYWDNHLFKKTPQFKNLC